MGKWVYQAPKCYYGEITRTVTTRPFGFTRVKTETQRVPDAVRDIPKYVRALNGEPEPEVKLDDGSADIPIGFPWLENSYRFSTAALKAELARRTANDLGVVLTNTGRPDITRGSDHFVYLGSFTNRRTTARRVDGPLSCTCGLAALQP